ncbi:cellulose binding domain-containing protein [Micromonospora sp. NPDC000316]|uniref:cellulose binding domain-containing protein n=1 Tax=Micromonospora sp. NPDC000316 TaxID=3364216 RepID=UPI0036BC8903
MSGMRRAPRPLRGPAAIASSPWIVACAGLVVMVVLLIVALGAYRGQSPVNDAVPPAVLPLPQVPGEPSDVTEAPPLSRSSSPVIPGLSPRASGLPPRAPAVSPSPSPRVEPVVVPTSARPSTRAPQQAPSQQPAVTGRYRVVQSFDGGFIGEVLIVNASRVDRGWTVRIHFGRGRLVTSWVEGAPQGTVRQFDGGFTYGSGVSVPAGRSVPLRFHLEWASTTPRGCTVDGVRCGGF